MLALACLPPAAAEPFSLLPGEDLPHADGSFSLHPSLLPAPPPDFRAAVAAEAAAAVATEAPVPEGAPLPKKSPARLLTAGILLGSAASALQESFDSGFVPFHADNEHWFGKHTYAGGADKAPTSSCSTA